MTIEQIWQQYRHDLQRFLRSKINDPDEVDDLLQEVLLKVHRHLDRGQQHGSLKSWLFTIANNTIIDFYRARGRRQLPDDEQLWYQPDDHQQAQELAECIRPFIEALPDDSRDLLQAIELDGQSQKALAAEQGIAYSTLKSRVQKGRAQLHQLFDQCCAIELDSQGRLVDYTPRNNGCGRC